MGKQGRRGENEGRRKMEERNIGKIRGVERKENEK